MSVRYRMKKMLKHAFVYPASSYTFALYAIYPTIQSIDYLKKVSLQSHHESGARVIPRDRILLKLALAPGFRNLEDEAVLLRTLRTITSSSRKRQEISHL